MSKDNNRLLHITGILWLVLGLGIDLFYFAVFGKKMLDSDMSGEMILANLLNSEKSITGLSRNWYYSTELRVFHMQWLYRIGLLFSPNNWYVARVIGMVLGLGIFVFAVYRLFVRCNLKDYAVWAVALCIFPGGSWYFWQTLYGGFYLPYILISVFALDLIVLLAGGCKKKWIFTAVLLFLGLLSGLNGIKQLMVFYAPLVIGSIIYGVLKIREDKSGDIRKSFSYMVPALGVTISALIGYVINSRILSKIYCFKQYGDQQITQGGVWECLKLYVWSFGFAYGRKLMSFTGIAAMIGLLIGIATLFCGARLIARWNEHGDVLRYLIVICVSVIVFNVFIFAYVGGEIQYFQPTVPFGLFLIALEIGTEKYVLKYSRLLIFNVTMLAMLVTSIGTIHSELAWPFHFYNAKPGMIEVAAFVQENGYTEGVGSFWVSNLITELSDGNVEMWSIDEPENFEVYPWLQVTSHSEGLPSGRYFVISEESEDYSGFLECNPEFKEIYRTGSLIVYGN